MEPFNSAMRPRPRGTPATHRGAATPQIAGSARRRPSIEHPLLRSLGEQHAGATRKMNISRSALGPGGGGAQKVRASAARRRCAGSERPRSRFVSAALPPGRSARAAPARAACGCCGASSSWHSLP